MSDPIHFLRLSENVCQHLPANVCRCDWSAQRTIAARIASTWWARTRSECPQMCVPQTGISANFWTTEPWLECWLELYLDVQLTVGPKWFDFLYVCFIRLWHEHILLVLWEVVLWMAWKWTPAWTPEALYQFPCQSKNISNNYKVVMLICTRRGQIISLSLSFSQQP